MANEEKFLVMNAIRGAEEAACDFFLRSRYEHQVVPLRHHTGRPMRDPEEGNRLYSAASGVDRLAVKENLETGTRASLNKGVHPGTFNL